MKKAALVAVIMFFAAAVFAPHGASVSGNDPDIAIRVAIIDDKDSLYLSLKGKYRILEVNSDRVLLEGPYLNAKVLAAKEGLRIGNKDMKVYGVKIKAARDSNIYVDGRRFRGDIDIVKKENLKLMVINHIGLDDYLYGVLYHEVSHRWPMEVLKAQAIAARTFALYQARQNKLQPYDLRNDIYSQVYGGRTSEKWSTSRAVDLTRGQVLVYKGDIIPSYYHAACAGHTEDASNLWGIDMEPLKGVSCDLCRHSPHYRWAKEIPLWEIENKLKDNGYKIGGIVAVSILSKNKSLRADKIEIKDSSGVSCILSAKDFRQMLGPNVVRSTKFDLSVKWDRLAIEAFGWGHGVGMCQWGAYAMAKQGRKCGQILDYYYPGAEITTIDKIASKL